MSTTKKKKTMRLGSLLEAAIKKRGLAVPTTEAEIAAIEKELEAGDAAYPARLREVPDFSSSARPRFRLAGPAVLDEATSSEMARAAREGGEIPKDIEEKMARDRQKAEASRRAKDHEKE